MERAKREVTVKGMVGQILDWEGSDSLSLSLPGFDGCLQVSRDPMFSDAVIVAIAESMERVKEAS